MEMNNKYKRNWAHDVQLSVVGAYKYKVPTMTLPSGRVINFVHTEMDSFLFRKDYSSWGIAQRWARYWSKKLRENGAFCGDVAIYSSGRETNWSL